MKMISFVGTFLVLGACVVFNTPVSAQELSKQKDWRALTDNLHLHSGKCCFCAKAERAKPTQDGSRLEYFAHGNWYDMRGAFHYNLDPEKLTQGTVICDPVRREYFCIVSRDGTS